MTERSERMLLAGFIMTYCRPAILAETVRAVQSQTRPPERLLIVDNDPDESARPVAEAAGVDYLPMGDNVGPAGAAAAGLRALAEGGADWIWWGDDDNPPKRLDALERLMVLAEREAARADVPPVGVAVSKGGRWDWKRGRPVRLRDDELRGAVMELDGFAGNGDPLIRREVVEAVGVPDASLFFGFEEREYALRIRRAGYRIVASGDDFHARREQGGHLGKEVSGQVMRPASGLWREYYSYRNQIYIHRTVLERAGHAWGVAGRALGKAALSYRRGFGYGRRASGLLLRAVWDGMTGRMGRRVEPVSKYGGAEDRGRRTVAGIR